MPSIGPRRKVANPPGCVIPTAVSYHLNCSASATSAARASGVAVSCPNEASVATIKSSAPVPHASAPTRWSRTVFW